MPNKIACRYGKNGYFGICGCDACRNIIIVTDEMRMAWLERMCVEVRTPMRHGSHALFTAQAINEEWRPHFTDLRKQVDAEIIREERERRKKRKGK